MRLNTISRICKIIVRGKVQLLFLSLVLSLLACDKELDIQTNFPFELEIMPIPAKIENEQTVEIHCKIKRQGHYNGTQYSIRYFPYEGKGALMLPQEKPFKPNQLYPLHAEEFTLHYKAKTKGSHEFQIWVSDNFGNERTAEFSFN